MTNDRLIFLSYRRSDAAGHARALHRDLLRRFPASQVFFDRSNIESGDRFDAVLRACIEKCRVLVVLIGPDWLDARDAYGRRRLGIADDFVRREVELGLQLDKEILPVLFDGAAMPPMDRLPEGLKRLALREALTLGGKTDEYDRQLDTLTKLLIQRAPGLRQRTPSLVRGYNALFRAHGLFAGRDAELAEMDAWLADSPRGHLLLTGRSAAGKTALLVNWVNRLLDREKTEVAYHFLSAKEGTASEDQMLRSLIEQLLAIRDVADPVPGSLDELRVMYAELLEHVPRGDQVVVIDGLDEVESSVPWWRHLPADLPEGLFLVFSARAIADVDWLEQLRLGDASVETVDLDARSLDEAGVRDLLVAAGGRARAFAERADQVHQLASRTAGDPLLLKFLVADIAEGTFEKVPSGLNDYLDEWWQAISDTAAEAPRVQQLLGYLMAARGRLTRDDLIALGPSDVLNGFTIDSALKSLRRFVLGYRDQGYRICHPLFQDYVAHHVLGGETASRERLREYCDRWAEHRSRYAIAAYPSHLIDTISDGQPAANLATFDRLAEVLTDRAYQDAYFEYEGDFGALQQTMSAALRSAPEASNGGSPVTSVMRLALGIGELRPRLLDPEAIFTAAAAGDSEEAEKRLRLFGASLRWRQLAYPVIAVRAAGADATATKRFLSSHEADLDDAHMLYTVWPNRVRASLEGLPEPELVIPYAGPFGGATLPDLDNVSRARALVSRIGGQLGANPSAFDPEVLRAGPQPISNLGEMDYGVETPNYVVEADSPELVAVAERVPNEGMELLREYIAIHGANPYREYRNRSLFGIAGAVICHRDLDTATELLQLLIAKALQPGGADYTESPLIATTALAAAAGDTDAAARLEAMRTSALTGADRLGAEPGGDSWAHHCRRLSMLAEAYCVALDDSATAHVLLECARHLPFGYAGFQAPASLTLAESFRICRPDAEAERSEACERALRSAHKVQEPPFCAATTARVNALVTWWWERPIDELEDDIRAFHAEAGGRRFTALHWAHEDFGGERTGSPNMLPIPPKMLDAATLGNIAAAVYRLPLRELERVNPDIRPDDQLEKSTAIHVPDPSFTPLLASRLAAEVVAERGRLGDRAVPLLVKLVDATVGNPTALNLVLARMLLIQRTAAGPILAAACDLAADDWMVDPVRVPPGQLA